MTVLYRSSRRQDTASAVATATEALNAASAGIEDIPEESRNDARDGSSGC